MRSPENAHAGAPLKNGWCERGKVICPFHRHEFDLISGRVILSSMILLLFTP
jgi:nitrite reductase (NADH) small subunit/3-phenylpropionate/trans-cinnamate dioxygenase ferredoxin subunit